MSSMLVMIPGHWEKIYFVRFHPLAQDVLASAAYDMTVRIWDLETGEEKIRLDGHTDSVRYAIWLKAYWLNLTIYYCRPCILRPPTGAQKCGLASQMVFKVI